MHLRGGGGVTARGLRGQEPWEAKGARALRGRTAPGVYPRGARGLRGQEPWEAKGARGLRGQEPWEGVKKTRDTLLPSVGGGAGRTMSISSKPVPVKVYQNSDEEKESIVNENKGRTGIYR